MRLCLSLCKNSYLEGTKNKLHSNTDSETNDESVQGRAAQGSHFLLCRSIVFINTGIMTLASTIVTSLPLKKGEVVFEQAVVQA